jgi:hypothetical protein
LQGFILDCLMMFFVTLLVRGMVLMSTRIYRSHSWWRIHHYGVHGKARHFFHFHLVILFLFNFYIDYSLFYLQFTLVGLDFANNSLRTHFETAFRISMIIKLKHWNKICGWFS